MLSQDDTLRVLYSYSEIEHSCIFAIRRCIVEGSKKFTSFARHHSCLFLDLSNQGFFQALLRFDLSARKLVDAAHEIVFLSSQQKNLGVSRDNSSNGKSFYSLRPSIRKEGPLETPVHTKPLTMIRSFPASKIYGCGLLTISG